jgi:hypothetical protein
MHAAVCAASTATAECHRLSRSIPHDVCCAALQVARAVLLLVCWWPFNYTGYPLSWRSALVMVWGGLRGAVGMVMALFIFLDTRIHDSRFKSYCIFYMGTMAFFTVLINGGSTKVCEIACEEGARYGLLWLKVWEGAPAWGTRRRDGFV